MTRQITFTITDEEIQEFAQEEFDATLKKEEIAEILSDIELDPILWQEIDRAKREAISLYASETDEWCTKCGKSGRFYDSICEACTKIRS